MAGYFGLVFISFLQLIVHYGCTEVVLSTDRTFVSENSTLTFTCSTQTNVRFIELFKANSQKVKMGYLNSSCRITILVPPMSRCSCVSLKTYTCITHPLTRLDIIDRWYCSATVEEGIAFNSNNVSIDVRVQIALVTISPYLDTPMPVEEGTKLSLICETFNGLPAANITWFMENQTNGSFVISNYSIVHVTENTDRTKNTKSTLTYTVWKSDQGMRVYCNASNEDHHELSSKVIRLNVRYFPEKLVYINGNESQYTFKMIRNSGTKQSLQCSVHGGNPLANLSWSCFNGNQTDMNTPSSAISNITWVAGDFSDMICTCNASHVLGWSVSQVVLVHVLFEPSFIRCIVGNAELHRGILNVTLFSNVTIICSSDGTPTPNNYTWIWPSGNISTGHLLSYRNIQHSFQGRYTLFVENVMKPSIGTTVKGYVNATFDIRVQYPPKTPSFIFHTTDTNITRTSISVIKGEDISLACKADGNPLPSYTWSTGQVVQNITTVFDSDTNLTCEVSNTLYPTGDKRLKTTFGSSLQIKVLYPPDTPAFRFSSTCMKNCTMEQKVLRVLELDQVSVECFSAGNPEPTYQWNNHSQSRVLHITKAAKEAAGSYSCHVSNTMQTTYGMTMEGRNISSFFLDILYPPKVTNVTKRVEVLEGDNLHLTCEAEPGNPNDTFFFWTRREQPKRNTSDQYLTIRNIPRTEEGNFSCFAENIMHPTGCQDKNGSDVQVVYVDVQYKATIKTFEALNTTVHHGDILRFACDVDSDPPASITILSPTGFTLEYIQGTNQLNYNKTSSCLEDIGQFTCESKNKHNHMQPESSNVTVDVQCSPRYPVDYNNITVIESSPGEKAVINFTVFSNPPPTSFTWTNISNNIQTSINTISSDRVIINTTDMSSALIITSVEPSDSGNYFVRVDNELGSMNETFRIIVDKDQLTTVVPSTISITPINLRNQNNIGAVVGGSVGAITGVVITAVVILIVFYRRIKNSKGTPPHDNNKLQLLQDTGHKSDKMEMENFDNVLPTNDETPKYEEEKNIYGNIQTKDAFGKSLAITILRDTVQRLKLDPVPLFKEFYTLQMGLKYETKEALKTNNVAKNRYRSVYPYDSSRVVLAIVRDEPDSDFINASYIDGYSKPHKYIAAQGPLENTISDTWRMIHSEDIKIIVMVTNLIETVKRKCFKYWPDDRATYGKCYVKLDQVDEYADFVVRHFSYSMEGTRLERQLIQFHYTSWPDKNVPTTALSLVQFWRKVRQSDFVEKTPWMVHCSAGVGRTGTFIALDYLFDQGKADGKLNVAETVNVLREQRISMVQTKEQYLYLHEAITELLDPIGQIFAPENSLRLQSEEKKINKEFKAITSSIVHVKTDFEENDYDLKRMPDGLLPENISKSIDRTVIPDDLFRPLISTGNDFINAVYIPTYRDAEKYIVTQFPLQTTILDFVRLLWFHNIQDVVLLDDGKEKHCYWPLDKTPLYFEPFVISLLSMDEAKNCTTRRIDISLAEKRQNKQTVVHQFTAWPGYLNLCKPKPLTEFLQTISGIAGPVVVQCHDGYSRSGLFAALLSIVDRIKTDKEVAIADTVRLVKHRRQAAITDVEQYQFCHEVVFEYLKGRETQTGEKENQEYVNMTFPKFQ